MSLKKEIKQGVLISTIAQYSTTLSQLVFGMILSRILTPVEFGIVASVMVFIVFFNLISTMGIGPAIIQNSEIDEKDVSVYFLFTVVCALLLSLIFVGLSFALVRFYSDYRYFKIGACLSVAVFFSTLTIVPTAIAQKEKRFKQIGIVVFFSNLISGVAAILMAKAGFSYFSLIGQSILYSLIAFMGMAYVCQIFKKFLFKKVSLNDMRLSLKKIAVFSSYTFAFNFINYFSRNLDNLLIGRFFGISQLGYYDKAYKLMLFPVQSLNQVVSPVFQSSLSNKANEIVFVVFLKITRLLALLGIPLTVFLHYNSEEIILLMYGSQWINAAPLLKVLSLTVWIQIILAATGSFFLVTRKPNLYFLSGFFGGMIITLAVVIGIWSKNIVHLSYLILTAYYLYSLFTLYILVTRIFKKNFLVFVNCLLKPSLVGLCTLLGIIVGSYFDLDNISFRMLFSTLLAILGFLVGGFFTQEYKLIWDVLNTKNKI